MAHYLFFSFQLSNFKFLLFLRSHGEVWFQERRWVKVSCFRVTRKKEALWAVGIGIRESGAR
jgi:hypothetical protein